MPREAVAGKGAHHVAFVAYKSDNALFMKCNAML